MSRFSESIVEEAALAWLESIRWQVTHGPCIAPELAAAERADDGGAALSERLRDAVLSQLISGMVR